MLVGQGAWELRELFAQLAERLTERVLMEWFDLGYGSDNEPGGVLELPESITGPHMALELHITVGHGGRTVSYWMLDDGVFLAEIEPGLA